MRIVSNTELFNIEQDPQKIIDMQKQKQIDLKSIDYAINLNTGKVKINSNNIFLKILSRIMMINCIISYKL